MDNVAVTIGTRWPCFPSIMCNFILSWWLDEHHACLIQISIITASYCTLFNLAVLHPQEAKTFEFVDQPDSDYFCPVCQDLLTEPFQPDCGHHLCLKFLLGFSYPSFFFGRKCFQGSIIVTKIACSTSQLQCIVGNIRGV